MTSPPESPAADEVPGRHPVKPSAMRRAIARRMAESKQQVPHFYLSTEIAMDALLAVAGAANAGLAREERLTVTAFLLRAVALTLAEHPAFNAAWSGDTVERWDAINIGVAIALDDGLIAPALLDCRGGGARVAAENVGERIAMEAHHAIIDADPWAVEIDRSDWGSVTPIALYRRRLAEHQPPQVLRTARRIVSLPLLDVPPIGELERELADRRADLADRAARDETRVTMNPIRYHISWLELQLRQDADGGRSTAVDGEIWAARIGDTAIVGAPGEIFGAIGTAVRRQSPAPVTIFAGYSQGSLGYVATPDEYPHGGYEPSVSHRGYGQPAPFSPEVAGIIERTAVDLLRDLFS